MSPQAMFTPERKEEAPWRMAPHYRSQLLRDLATAIRARHFSPRTERACAHWVRRYVLHHGRRHPSELGAAEVNAFLRALAVEGNVAASTQAQARAALLFLYRDVLRTPLELREAEGTILRARQPRRLPTVLDRDEVKAMLSHMVPPPVPWHSSSTGRGCASTKPST